LGGEAEVIGTGDGPRFEGKGGGDAERETARELVLLLLLLLLLSFSLPMKGPRVIGCPTVIATPVGLERGGGGIMEG